MEDLFVQNFIPNAKLLKKKSCVGINIYENNTELFALVNADKIGPATEELKQGILQSENKPVKCVSLFKNRMHYADSEEVAFGTYVWFSDSPNHFVYFEENASEVTPFHI
jgi:hypothetical protein